MACNCISELPKKVLEHCNAQKAYEKKPVLNASFKDLVFPLDVKSGQMTTALKADVKLTVEGRKSPKIETMMFVYCPFCGVKYNEATK